MASTRSFGSGTKQSTHPFGATSVGVSTRGSNSILMFSTASVVLLGAMVAVPASFLCIARRLEAITTSRGSESRQSKTFEAAFEAATCFALPALYMGLRASLWCLEVDVTELIMIPTQTQSFRTIALLYLRISAARQQSTILSLV